MHSVTPKQSEKVFSSQISHAAGPDAPLAVPPAHNSHATSAASADTLYAPASHTQSVTTVLPRRACELRAGHGWHAVWFGTGLNESSAHCWHAPPTRK